MTAALKMAAPGEPCAQTEKLLAFCTGWSKSIKEIKRKLAVTEDRTHELLNEALKQGLIAKETGGKYFTVARNCKGQLISVLAGFGSAASLGLIMENMKGYDEDAVKVELAALVSLQKVRYYDTSKTYYLLKTATVNTAEAKSLTALSEAPANVSAGVFDVPVSSEQEEVIDVDQPIDTFTNVFCGALSDELSNANLRQQQAAQFEAELKELTSLLNPPAPPQLPVIEQIDAKQHTLDVVAILLKPRMPLMASTIEQLSVDLAEIKLHQERRAQ